MDLLRERTARAKRNVTSKRHKDGWVLEKQAMTFADENTWSNRDQDVTPLERRTWTSWTILGFWFSDALSAQSWSGASAIIAVGLTWYVPTTRTAVGNFRADDSSRYFSACQLVSAEVTQSSLKPSALLLN